MNKACLLLLSVLLASTAFGAEPLRSREVRAVVKLVNFPAGATASSAAVHLRAGNPLCVEKSYNEWSPLKRRESSDMLEVEKISDTEFRVTGRYHGGICAYKALSLEVSLENADRVRNVIVELFNVQAATPQPATLAAECEPTTLFPDALQCKATEGTDFGGFNNARFYIQRARNGSVDVESVTISLK